MKSKIKVVFKEFDGKLIGKPLMKSYVCETILLLPLKYREYITKNCWFISSMSNAWAFAFTGNDLINKHLIFLSDELLHQDKKQIQYTIIHEIGHVILGHKNSVERIQTQSEIKIQEKEADAFALQFIS